MLHDDPNRVHHACHCVHRHLNYSLKTTPAAWLELAASAFRIRAEQMFKKRVVFTLSLTCFNYLLVAAVMLMPLHHSLSPATTWKVGRLLDVRLDD